MRAAHTAIALLVVLSGMAWAPGTQAAHTITITGIAPTTGAREGGNTFTITGTGFQTASATTVTFGSIAATNVQVNSATSISGTIPASPGGAVAVTITVTNGDTSSTLVSGFTYQSVAVSSVSPKYIPVNTPTIVTATGTGFCLSCPNEGNTANAMHVETRLPGGEWTRHTSVSVLSATSLDFSITRTATTCVELRVKQQHSTSTILADAVCGVASTLTPTAGQVSEDFEALTPGQTPTMAGVEISTSGSGTCQIAVEGSVALGTRSLKVVGESGCLVSAPGSTCAGTVQFRYPVLTSGGFTLAMSSSRSLNSVDTYWTMGFAQASPPTLSVRTGASTIVSTQFSTFAASANQWNLLTTTCQFGGTTGHVTAFDNTGTGFRRGVGTDQSVNAAYWVINVGNGQTLYLDNFLHTPAPEAPPTVGFTTVTVNDLVGFDVDPMQRAMIARTWPAGPTSYVRVYDPHTLAQQGASPVETGCSKNDGVMAHGLITPPRGYVGYLACESSGGQASRLYIRDNLLGTPSQAGTICEGQDYCWTYLETEGAGLVCPGDSSNQLPGGTANIANVLSIPISWEGSEDQSGFNTNNDNVLLGFAFHDVGNGHVGVWVTSQIADYEDESCGLSVPYAPPGNSVDLCSWRNEVDGKDYLAAASIGKPAVVWRLDVYRHHGNLIEDAASPATQPDVRLTQVFSSSAPFGDVRAVACAGDHVYLLSGAGVLGKVRAMNGNVGAIEWQKTGMYVLDRSVAAARDGRHVAYFASSSTIQVARTTANDTLEAGDVVSSHAVPAGGFKAIRLSDTALDLYVATAISINRAELKHPTSGASLTGGQPPGTRLDAANATVCRNNQLALIDCSELGLDTQAPVRGSGLPGIDPEAFSAALGITREAGGWVLGLFLLVVLTGGFYMVRPVLGVIGALLGVGMNVAFGYFPLWFLLVLVLLGAAALVLKHRGVGS